MAAKKKTQKSPAAGGGGSNSNVQTLASVVKLFDSSGLWEMEFEDKDVRVRLARGASAAFQPAGAAAGALMMQPPAAPHTHVTAPSEPAPAEEGGHIITSPFVGTFYRAPNPDSPPFVQVGSVVKAGQTLCIVEAMKLMNEIEADDAGRVTEIFAENGQPVEFGQKLFRVVSA